MTNLNVDQVLNQMKVLSQNDILPKAETSLRPDFSQLLRDSIGQVNSLQQEAGDMKTAYAVGDTTADISEVMIAAQKASLSFEALTEVRNKLLSAYQEVMNMQV